MGFTPIGIVERWVHRLQGRSRFSFIRLLGNLHRALRCFFHGVINVFEGFVEAAGRNPATLNKFNNDFFGSSQYLFVDGRHITAPLPRKLLSRMNLDCY